MSAGAAAASAAAQSIVQTGADYFMQQAANISNAKQAKKQRAWAEQMSNTAHQRQVEDLRKAGLNPLLSAGGGGASTSSVSAPVMQASRVAGGLDKVLSSAQDAKRLDQEMKASDAQIGLAKASAATQATQAEANTANAIASKLNAEQTSLKNEAIRAQMPAIAKRAEADFKHAEYDSKWAAEDAIIRRTGNATGAIGNLLGVGKFFKGLGGSSKDKRSRGYRDEHYDSQGEHRGSTERYYLD